MNNFHTLKSGEATSTERVSFCSFFWKLKIQTSNARNSKVFRTGRKAPNRLSPTVRRNKCRRFQIDSRPSIKFEPEKLYHRKVQCLSAGSDLQMSVVVPPGNSLRAPPKNSAVVYKNSESGWLKRNQLGKKEAWKLKRWKVDPTTSERLNWNPLRSFF